MGSPLPVVNRDQLPLVFHEPHVYTGFRPLHQPWRNYLLSLFQWHNEVMNVWTHLVALVVVVARAWIWSREFDMVYDPYMWPLAVGISSMVVLYTCSCCAHCFSNRSELTHCTCFMCDYAGIGLYGFGSTILHYWYCLHQDFLGSISHQLATPVGALLGILVCVCCSISRIRYRRPYPFVRRVWQMSSVLAIYLWLIFPIWYKIGLYLYNGTWESSFKHHLQQMGWFTLGGFFFGSDIPQRFFPGRFDLVGHSHQLFHVCIFMTTFEQMNALYLEMTDGIDAVRSMEAPTLLNTWGWFWAVVAANAFVVYTNHVTVSARLNQEAEEEAVNGKTPGEVGSCCTLGESRSSYQSLIMGSVWDCGESPRKLGLWQTSGMEDGGDCGIACGESGKKGSSSSAAVEDVGSSVDGEGWGFSKIGDANISTGTKENGVRLRNSIVNTSSRLEGYDKNRSSSNSERNGVELKTGKVAANSNGVSQ